LIRVSLPKEQTVSGPRSIHERSEQAFTATGRINRRITLTVTAGPGGITAEWSPAMPARLNGAELDAYRRIRGEALRQLAERMGGAVLVLEA
jgi:hypothetical protein